jgi:hypothetical protein
MPESKYSRDQFLTELEAASVLKLAPKTLKNWRGIGKGPTHKKFSNRAIRYRYGDLLDWAESKTRKSTSDLGILQKLK